ncbi:hypothetical protein GIB67_031576 [Kingdonia uniflora]|uniref:Protein GAMETE EXPRESSED 2 n=1 Tax=Kingdonia uniflora TaxID=39325 RepID=A0A7J7PBD4_9MAGN|nr:hypothetical protein GIB67_031576 [Kingdonia uniflora]
MELSKVVKFVAKVPKLIKNEIAVQLVDSFSNPVSLQQRKISLEVRSVNNSGFLAWTFVDNNNGSYTGHYLAKEIGAYEICVSFEDKYLSPCSFWIYVYSSEYFPKAYNDTISVWEDESITFDASENDYFAGGTTSIVTSSKPNHGSLLQYGRLFRYTPYKGFFGNDSFAYTISDINNNSASGVVNISILVTPPQFVSLPVQLQATEDILSPRFGGFYGFEIQYSDPAENISVTLNAMNGRVFLSPMLMQFWQPAWSSLSVDVGEGDGKSLILIGCVEVLNAALQSIQYLGNKNYYGNDMIRVSTTNKNGIHDSHIPVVVEPINDPPFIHVPDFIILPKKGKKDGSLIFDKQRDKFEFSVGDPDHFTFPGNQNLFLISLSMEVNDGMLITNLPSNLINTTELKLKNNYQWQPLQTFVCISKHFLVKVKGVRLRGTIKDCNEAMKQLSYKGGEQGAVLTVTVNDMGNYGCYPDCQESMSVPLVVETTVNLIWRRPLSSFAAHTLGSAIVIEFIMIFFLGALLLFFICKCAFLLGNERRSRYTTDIKPSGLEKFAEPASAADLSRSATYFTACCSSPFLHRSQTSNFRQRSRRQSGTGNHSSQSSNGRCQRIPVTNFIPLSIEMAQRETA